MHVRKEAKKVSQKEEQQQQQQQKEDEGNLGLAHRKVTFLGVTCWWL